MQHSPSSEANQFWARQKIPCTVRNPTVHYHSHI